MAFSGIVRVVVVVARATGGGRLVLELLVELVGVGLAVFELELGDIVSPALGLVVVVELLVLVGLALVEPVLVLELVEVIPLASSSMVPCILVIGVEI
mgnify:CR=1 FL=1